MNAANNEIRNIIAKDLQVSVLDAQGIIQETTRRVDFIKERVRASGTKALVLGISGGVDSLTAGILCQVAARQLREEGYDAKFIAVRLPYRTQRDEADAQLSLEVIDPDEIQSINIGGGVDGLCDELSAPKATAAQHDFVKGNIKARIRMVAQYAIANYENGLVVGSDHSSESVSGYFTKHGDGACDLAPLFGLVKSQVRAIASSMGAPDNLVYKTPTADLEDLDPGKPDEVAYGYTYEDIDNFLLGKDVSDEVAEIIIATYNRTAHKRVMPYVPGPRA